MGSNAERVCSSKHEQDYFPYGRWSRSIISRIYSKFFPPLKNVISTRCTMEDVHGKFDLVDFVFDNYFEEHMSMSTVSLY